MSTRHYERMTCIGVKEDVGGLEVVVDDGFSLLVQVFEALDNLVREHAHLLHAERLVALEVFVEVAAAAVLEHRAEAILVYFEDVVEADDSRVLLPRVSDAKRRVDNARGSCGCCTLG